MPKLSRLPLRVFHSTTLAQCQLAKNYIMKRLLILSRRVIALYAALVLCSVAPAATITWNGGGANKNWSDAGAGGNWSGSAEPGAGDTAYFTNTASVGTGGAGSVNNIVDASVTISNLI